MKIRIVVHEAEEGGFRSTQQAAEDGPATLGEARGDFRRRFLTPHSIGLNDEAFLPSPALAGSGGPSLR